MRMNRRGALAAGGAALALASAGIGVAAAQQTKTPIGEDKVAVRLDAGDLKADRDKFLNSLAGKLGVGRDKLDAAIADAAKDAGLPPGFPMPLVGPLPGPLPAGKAEAGVFFMKAASGGKLEAAAAKALGMTDDQLAAERKAGKSLADIARERGVDPNVVADAIKADLPKPPAPPDPNAIVDKIMNAKPGEGVKYVVAKPGT